MGFMAGRYHGHQGYEDCEPIVRGAVHELEHTDDWDEAMAIAADHLRERQDYYEVLEKAMTANPGGFEPNLLQAAGGAVAMALLPYAIDLATQYPSESKKVLGYAAMVAFPPYGLARVGWAATRGLRGRVKRAFGYQQNAGVGSAIAKLAPSLRAVVPNLLKWMVEAYKLAKAGVGRSTIVKWLTENKIGHKLANAIVDAVVSVIADEAASGVRSGGKRIKERVTGRRSEVAENPDDFEPNAPRYDEPARYWVWAAAPQDFDILEGPYGPYPFSNAKQYARIAATKGNLHRIVTNSRDFSAKSFKIVRIYAAGTGERIDEE